MVISSSIKYIILHVNSHANTILNFCSQTHNDNAGNDVKLTKYLRCISNKKSKKEKKQQKKKSSKKKTTEK